MKGYDHEGNPWTDWDGEERRDGFPLDLTEEEAAERRRKESDRMTVLLAPHGTEGKKGTR